MEVAKASKVVACINGNLRLAMRWMAGRENQHPKIGNRSVGKEDRRGQQHELKLHNHGNS